MTLVRFQGWTLRYTSLPPCSGVFIYISLVFNWWALSVCEYCQQHFVLFLASLVEVRFCLVFTLQFYSYTECLSSGQQNTEAATRTVEIWNYWIKQRAITLYLVTVSISSHQLWSERFNCYVGADSLMQFYLFVYFFPFGDPISWSCQSHIFTSCGNSQVIWDIICSKAIYSLRTVFLFHHVA